MSRYPVTYYSRSKKREEPIDEMASPHLLNAYRRLATDPESDARVRECFEIEIERRGLDPSKPNDQQPTPSGPTNA